MEVHTRSSAFTQENYKGIGQTYHLHTLSVSETQQIEDRKDIPFQYIPSFQLQHHMLTPTKLQLIFKFAQKFTIKKFFNDNFER